MNTKLGIMLAFVAGLIGITATREKVTVKFDPELDGPPPDSYFAMFSGYQRAKNDQVTPYMRAMAVRAIEEGHPLRWFQDFGVNNPFRVVVETHFNPSKGYHKGATIFLPV